MVKQKVVKIDNRASKQVDSTRATVEEQNEHGYRLVETIEIKGTTHALVFEKAE